MQRTYQHGCGAMPPLASRADAQHLTCTAIAALGQLAGIDVDLGEGPDDIDGNLIQAAYECRFDDPAFLGGGGFGAVASSADVQALAERASLVTRGLLRYLGRRASAEALREAQAQVRLVDAAFGWLERTVDGA